MISSLYRLDHNLPLPTTSVLGFRRIHVKNVLVDMDGSKFAVRNANFARPGFADGQVFTPAQRQVAPSTSLWNDDFDSSVVDNVEFIDGKLVKVYPSMYVVRVRVRVIPLMLATQERRTRSRHLPYSRSSQRYRDNQWCPSCENTGI